MKKDWECERCLKGYTTEELSAMASMQSRRLPRCQVVVSEFEVPSEFAGSLKCKQLCSGTIFQTRESLK